MKIDNYIQNTAWQQSLCSSNNSIKTTISHNSKNICWSSFYDNKTFISIANIPQILQISFKNCIDFFFKLKFLSELMLKPTDVILAKKWSFDHKKPLLNRPWKDRSCKVSGFVFYSFWILLKLIFRGDQQYDHFQWIFQSQRIQWIIKSNSKFNGIFPMYHCTMFFEKSIRLRWLLYLKDEMHAR